MASASVTSREAPTYGEVPELISHRQNNTRAWSAPVLLNNRPSSTMRRPISAPSLRQTKSVLAEGLRPAAPTWRPAPAQLARGVQLMQLRREDIVLVSEASHRWTAPFRNVHDPLWDDCHDWKREVLFREYRLAIESGRLPPRRDAEIEAGLKRASPTAEWRVARGGAWGGLEAGRTRRGISAGSKRVLAPPPSPPPAHREPPKLRLQQNKQRVSRLAVKPLLAAPVA